MPKPIDNDLPRVRAEEGERALAECASRSGDRQRAARRQYQQEPDPYRTEFERDYTRILHSRAFRRLRHKTQVFVLPQNDHICTRLEHSLHVASVARTVARALNLNLDLVAAIALGHDLGHAPFGHHGEERLQEIAKEHRLTYDHEPQSLRVVDLIESPYKPKHPGLNLTFAVRDGILMHCGEDYDRARLEPDWDRHDLTEGLRPEHGMPATLEGCVVRAADRVAYLGRDFEDAVDAKIVNRRDLPAGVRNTLGSTNREFIANLVHDIVQHSRGQGFIAINGEVRKALREFQEFSVERIYRHPKVTACFAQIKLAIGSMFDLLVEKLGADEVPPKADLDDEACHAITFLAEFRDEDLPETYDASNEQLVLDYIGGMTDQFFTRCYTELFLPHGSA